MAKYCPKCNDYWFAAKFCRRDGTALIEMSKCECGVDITPNDVFCSNCGKQVGVQKADVAATDIPGRYIVFGVGDQKKVD